MAMTDSQMKAMGMGMGGATAMAGLAGLFMGGGDPTKQAQDTLGGIPSAVSPYYQPYMDAGTSSMSDLQTQYTKLINDPGAVFNQMGESFQQSPGFDFAMQQALQGSNQAAASGGMAGSPQHEQQNQTVATGLANQDYYNYMNQVTGLYGQGLHGEQDMMHQGFNASQDMAQAIARSLAGQSLLQAQSAKAQAEAEGDFMSDIMGGATTAGMYAMML